MIRTNSLKIVLVGIIAAILPIIILSFLFHGNRVTSPLAVASINIAMSPVSSYLPAINSDSQNQKIAEPQLNATSALILEMPASRILYSKNIYTQRPIASLTKLLTALTVYDNLKVDDVITISAQAIKIPENLANLNLGEQLSVEQLLYALLVESSNDAAVALEQFYNSNKQKDVASFVPLMNQKAKSLQLYNTHFVEPTGLDAQNYSTAYDIANMLYAVFQNDMLARIIKTSDYSTESVDGKFSHYWVSSNKLLGTYNIVGGKTGYTEEAGQSMAVIASIPGDKYIIIVVLDAENREAEIIKLLDWVTS